MAGSRVGGSLEYAVLSALGTMGSASARDVYELIGEPRSLAYTTIATVLDRLCEKGLAIRKKAGRAFIYRARASGESGQRGWAVDAISSVLGSNPRPAIAALVDAVEAIDPALLKELERIVVARRRGGRGT